MPSVEGGGVEKNFFLIVNYLSKNLKKFNILTSNSFVGPMGNFPKCVERLVQPFTTSYESYIQTPS